MCLLEVLWIHIFICFCSLHVGQPLRTGWLQPVDCEGAAAMVGPGHQQQPYGASKAAHCSSGGSSGVYMYDGGGAR